MSYIFGEFHGVFCVLVLFCTLLVLIKNETISLTKLCYTKHHIHTFAACMLRERGYVSMINQSDKFKAQLMLFQFPIKLLS